MGNTLVRETMGVQTKRVYNWVSWLLTGGLFIAIIIYAGIRGHQAYNQTPSETLKFVPMTSVNFPAITFCPLVPIKLTIIECEQERNDVGVKDCYSTVQYSSILIESKNHTCITVNAFSDPSKIIASNNMVDEIGIQMSVNMSTLPADDPTAGAFVIVQPQGTAPVLAQGSSFVADVGKIMEVMLRVNQLTFMNGTTVLQYVASASGATNVGQAYQGVMDVDFNIYPLGIYQSKEYFAYTVQMWIGEVGGFACLFTFLHLAALFLFMLVYRALSKEPTLEKSEALV